jgi:dUTP pyrophosphatase
MLDSQTMQVVITDDRILQPEGMNQLLKGTEHAAGYDLVAYPPEPVSLYVGAKPTLIPLGIRLHIKHPNLVGMVFPRSGLGHKKGLVLGNSTGVIDADYQGDMFVSALNRSQETIVIHPGERIAQIVFQYVHHPVFELATAFEEITVRGEGGFGSTGISTGAVH